MVVRKKKRSYKKVLFYSALLALPLLQFCVFYIYVNFNSVILAFQEYDAFEMKYSFVWTENFEKVFEDLFVADKVAFAIRFRNSFFNYLMSLAVGMVGAIFFSYYIYKKQFFSDIFKIVLFIPHIIPAVALLNIFKYFIDSGGVYLVNNVFHLERLEITSFLNDPRFNYPVILSYSLFIGFGTQVLMYLGAMNKINPSITEAAELDGITFFRELWYITLPNVFSTVATFLVIGLTSFCIGDMGVYAMRGHKARGEIQTIGYYLHKLLAQTETNMAKGGYISAFGLCCTLIIAPLTFVLKQILDRVDPVA